MPFTLTSTAFENRQKIPVRFTDDGADVSPPLIWNDPPDKTKQLALICDDPDAPREDPWVHWIIYGLSPQLEGLPEGVPRQPELGEPIDAKQGVNSWPSDNIGYRGPAPPQGHGAHHYHFKLYALDSELDLAPGAGKQTLLDAMSGKILDEVELVGIYER